MEHTVKSYGEELNHLTAEVTRMGGLAEAQVADAIECIARRDGPLAQQVVARDERLDILQAEIERNALALLGRWFGDGGSGSKALMRLVVWAVRGLSIAQVLAPDPEEIEKSVTLLRRMLEVYAERPRNKD